MDAGASVWDKIQKHERWATVLFILEGLIIIGLIADVVYLNMYIFKNQAAKPSSQTAHPTQVTDISPTQITQLSPTPCDTCANATPTQVQTPSKQGGTTIIQNSVKDYYISLGSGTNQTSDWEDVPGAQAVVDFGQYGSIKNISFEASVYVENANEWVAVRLYNETDKHPVWNSDLMFNNGTAAYLTSQALAYDTGSKLYQVQMKTQLQYPATLAQSRLHILLK